MPSNPQPKVLLINSSGNSVLDSFTQSTSGHRIKTWENRLLTHLLFRSQVELLYPEGPPPSRPIQAPPGLTQAPFPKASPSLLDFFRHPLAAGLRSQLSSRPPQSHVLWMQGFDLLPLLPWLLSQGYRAIVDERSPAAKATRQWRFLRLPHSVILPSDLDASRLRKTAPNTPLHVIPDGVDLSFFDSIPRAPGQTLLFTGYLDYSPNIEGLHWFSTEIIPRLRAALGKGMPRVVVAGSNPDSGLHHRLESCGIEVRANPESLLPYLAEAAVVFFPIHRGKSLRLKILEAMAAGRAVVSTGKGAEGLILSPNLDIWISDLEENFTSALVRLFRNRDILERTAKHALKTIEERYDWRSIEPRLESVLDRLIGPRAPES